MKKALLITTVSGFVPQFEMNNVRLLQTMGYEVHYAANYNTPSYGDDNHRLDHTGIIRHQIDFVRSPFKPQNIHVYKELCSLMQSEQFDLIHCHTPMGGVIARLAAHATHTGPVIYTAHGFHFFKGASFINWLCYYPVEKFLSYYTDQQICINQEDYDLARQKFHAKHTDYIPGIGIDLTRIVHMNADEIAKKKEQLHLPGNQWIFLSSGEFIKRKNHETALRAFARLRQQRSDIHYAICGHGKLDSYLRNLVKELKIENNVSFLGYRTDMLEVLPCADVFVFPSFQEGLPIALLEAMATGLPIVCSDIRGSRDLMEKSGISTPQYSYCKGGIMVSSADNVDAYCDALNQLLSDPFKFDQMRAANISRANDFSVSHVIEHMKKIYQRLS